MKKILVFVILFASLKSTAQTDSTKIYNLQIMTRQLEYVIGQCLNPNKDSIHQVYIDMRKNFRIANPPSGATLVTIDSIPTVELAILYNYTLSNPDGIGYRTQFKATIAAARAANTYLDRLCTFFENYWANKLSDIRIAGRKILRGK